MTGPMELSDPPSIDEKHGLETEKGNEIEGQHSHREVADFGSNEEGNLDESEKDVPVCA